MEHLLYSTAHAVLSLVKYADSKVEDGTMKRKRFINPGWRRMKKWAANSLAVEDSSTDNMPDNAEHGMSSLQLGDSFMHRKDPEHLPPTNAFQRFGNVIRKIAHVMSSPEMAFGLRVGCATMSIAIVAYLRVSQAFFVEQRIVWAMIMVAISMTMTSGSGVFGFLGRCGGTAIAMCLSITIWYIAGGNGAPGGVLAVQFVVTMAEFYFLLKMPKFTVVAMITIVTQVRFSMTNALLRLTTCVGSHTRL